MGESEGRETIDDLLKRIQIEKIKRDIEDSNRSFFSKYIAPEFPKWVPTLIVGTITAYITLKSGVLSVREDKVAIEEKKAQLKNIQDSIYTLSNVKSKASDEVNIKLKEVQGLNNKLVTYQYLFEKEKSNTERLKSEQKDLEYKNKEIERTSQNLKSNQIIDALYYFPNVNSKYVLEIIEILNSESPLANKIKSELESDVSKNYHKSLNYYILYKGTNNNSYFTKLLSEVSSILTSQTGTYNLQSINENLNVIELGVFNKEQLKVISELILSRIYVRTNPPSELIRYYTLPNYYSYKYNNQGLDLFETKYWINYLAVLLNVLNNKIYLDISSIGDFDYNSKKTIFENKIKDKKSILYSINAIMPQVTFSLLIKEYSGEQSFKIDEFISTEKFKLLEYVINLKSNESDRCFNLYDSLYSSLDAFEGINKDTQTEDMFRKLNEMKTHFKNYYFQHKIEVDKWTDPSMNYFILNPIEFDQKIKACEL